jgi:uncharacterized repeat protein (TIGR03803 family)
VFELTPSNGGWTVSTLYSFTGGNDGANPFSGLVFDSAGNLYGTTYAGGSNGFGTVFRLAPSGSEWTLSVLYTFQGGNDGGSPLGGLIFDASGNLYGTTSRGGGTVYELMTSAGGWTFSTVYRLTSSPTASLVIDAAGTLFGQTVGGGLFGYGTIFKLALAGSNWVYTDLHDFSYNDGTNPYGAVINASGNLYGTTEYGGSHVCYGSGCGVVWEITP